MNGRLLIDAIVRQTTVLLAQLSTASGIRAPLAHIADEVFVSLAREIESQGVGRKVAADMFGLALRSYQLKVQRLTESATERERTLWEAVVDFIAERGRASRDQVLERFRHDDEREVVGVLTDLVNTGLLHATGRGAAAVYGLTTDEERRLVLMSTDAEATAVIAWAMLRGGPPTSTTELATILRLGLEQTRAIVRKLLAEERVTREADTDDAPLIPAPLVIPLGAELGWEGAVLDHFRAVANAIGAKLRQGTARAEARDVTGGTTVSFKLRPGHPHWERVRGLLARTRAEVDALWQEVEQQNIAHPFPDDAATRVWFYFGQHEQTETSKDAEP